MLLKLAHVALATVPGTGAVPPTSFLIWKFGKVATSKGTFLFDEQAAAAVMAEYRLHGNRLTFDYEHKATTSNGRAGDGKAAGSFLLELRTDGLYAADCRWTPAAAQGLRDREWLYHSPTFEVEEKSGRILHLINVALTNVPATRNLRPLVAAHSHGKTTIMNATAKKVSTDTQGPPSEDDDAALATAYAAKFKASRARLAKAKAEMDAAAAEHEHIAGFAREAAAPAAEEVAAEPPPADGPPADSGEEDTQVCPNCKKTIPADATKCPECGTELSAKTAASETPTPTTPPPKAASRATRDQPITAPADAAIARVACEVTGHTHPSEVAGALRALKEQADNAAGLASTNASMATELRGHQVRGMVDTAVRAMKLEPKKKAWALSVGMRDPKELEAFLATCTTPIAPTEQTRRVADPRIERVQLSAMELEMAERMGVKPEEWLVQEQANEARVRRMSAAAASSADDDEE